LLPITKSFIGLLTLCLAFAALAQGTTAPEIKPDDARRDLRILKRAFTELHPGLYRYTTPAALDAEFAAAEATVAQGASRGQMFLLASRIAASVHCGHTWTNRYNQRQDVQDLVFNRADKLPITLRWVQGRALVTGSMAPGVASGTELLAIDGRPVAQISAAVLPYLRADGLHEGALAKRWSQLDSGSNGGAMDRLFPLLFAPQAGQYNLDIRDREGAAPRSVQVAAVTLADRDRQLPPPSNDWQLRVEGDTAVLTLPTFAFWRSSFDPVAFLNRSFEQLRGVPYLVIDQRRNEGGDDAIGHRLMAHLLRQPFTLPSFRVESAYERAPYNLVRFLDTWDYGFFDRTGQVTRQTGNDSGSRNWRLADLPGRRIEPVAAPYAGRVLLLVGPQNSSAGFLLARDLKASRGAVLVGQPTGGNLRGLNGGQLAWVTLPASGVGVDIPLIGAFETSDPPDAGVLPDRAVAPRWSDAVAGVDTEMAAAQVLIAAWRRGAP
jgi:hypothetical protein